MRARLKDPPAAGLLFDVDSGEVLWARNPAAERPIASLTKIMTALVIAERHRAGERVLISEKAPGVEGSDRAAEGGGEGAAGRGSSSGS